MFVSIKTRDIIARPEHAGEQELSFLRFKKVHELHLILGAQRLHSTSGAAHLFKQLLSIKLFILIVSAPKTTSSKHLNELVQVIHLKIFECVGSDAKN